MVTMTAIQQQQYTAFLHRHAAQVRSVAAPFVGRLSNQDKEDLLTKALEFAWESRRQLKDAPQILLWWKDALRKAASTRKEWTVQYSDGDRVITSDKLGMEW